jgi:predicted DNA-binding transcriptional regulator AlpA
VASIMTNERNNKSTNFPKSVKLKLETCIMHLEQTEMYESAQYRQCDVCYILEAEHCFPLKEVSQLSQKSRSCFFYAVSLESNVETAVCWLCTRSNNRVRQKRKLGKQAKEYKELEINVAYERN